MNTVEEILADLDKLQKEIDKDWANSTLEQNQWYLRGQSELIDEIKDRIEGKENGN